MIVAIRVLTQEPADLPTDVPSISTFKRQEPTPPAPPGPTETAAFWLRRDIVRGVFLPNERLKVDQLSRFYGIGHSPIREAILLLSPSGLVAHEHQKGFRVAPVSLADYDDARGAYRRIQQLGLNMAMDRYDEAWEERVVLTLHRTSKVPKVLKGDPEAREMWQLAYKRLHAEIMSGCGSPLILTFYMDLGNRLERYLNLFGDLESDDLRDHHAEHRVLVDLLVKRDREPLLAEFDAFFGRNQPVRDTIVQALQRLEGAADPRRGAAAKRKSLARATTERRPAAPAKKKAPAR